MKTQAYPARASGWRWWDIILLPVLVVLTALEPLVNKLCAVVFVFGVIASVAFEVSAVGPQFPFAVMISIAFGALVFLVLYHLLLDILMRD